MINTYHDIDDDEQDTPAEKSPLAAGKLLVVEEEPESQGTYMYVCCKSMYEPVTRARDYSPMICASQYHMLLRSLSAAGSSDCECASVPSTYVNVRPRRLNM